MAFNGVNQPPTSGPGNGVAVSNKPRTSERNRLYPFNLRISVIHWPSFVTSHAEINSGHNLNTLLYLMYARHNFVFCHAIIEQCLSSACDLEYPYFVKVTISCCSCANGHMIHTYAHTYWVQQEPRKRYYIFKHSYILFYYYPRLFLSS